MSNQITHKYYLAVAPLPARIHSPKISIKVPRLSRSCIQLGSLGWSIEESGDDKGKMHREMLCIDSGGVRCHRTIPYVPNRSVTGCQGLGFMKQQNAIWATSSVSKKAGSARRRIRRWLYVRVRGSVPARSCVNRTLDDDDAHIW